MGEFEMSQVGEGSKKIKNFKKFIPFIAVGGVLGLIVFLKRGGTSSVALEDPGIGGNIAGAVSDQVNQNNEDLKSYFSSNFDTLAGHLFDTVDRSTESLTGAIDKQSSVIDTLKEDVKVLQSKPAGTIVQSPIVSSPVAVAPSKGLYSQIFDSVGANNSIYGDSISDGIQYVEKKAVIDTTVLTPQEKISVKSVLAGLGNNGVGYNEEATRQNNNKLKTDSSYKQSEIERTNLVVKNRKAQGLETTLQENYLKSINGV